jgi:hypothetical protein
MPLPFNVYIPGNPNPFYVPPPPPSSAFSTTVLPNSAPAPAPAPAPTPTPSRKVDPNLNSQQQEALDDLWVRNYPGWTETRQNEHMDLLYSIWGKTKPTTFTTTTTPAPPPATNSISNQLQQGMNALFQGEELPPFSQPPTTGPNMFSSDTTPILDQLPSYTSREELMENYAIPDDSWTGDMAHKEDNIFQGLADVFDPNRNGVADAFDPLKNGVADAFDPQKNGVANFFNQPEGEEEKSSMNLLLLGAGALILVYALM